VQWSANFDARITANPTAYGLTAVQATFYNGLHTAFQTAWQAANENMTRTPSAIQTKNLAKADLVSGRGGIRELAGIVQKFPGTTNTERSDLGLTVRDAEPTPIPPPTVSPEIDFIPTGTRTIRIRLHNEVTLNRRKPEGVKGATVFYHVGATPPAELSEWTFHENVTRTTLDVNLPPSIAPGSQVWFTAFWFNPRAQSGPAATPVSTFMQFGGLSMAA
jgi:hypothetical protein